VTITIKAPIALPQRPRILVISLRRIGDLLLATPLIRSLRRAWPQASIDVLVLPGTTEIVAGNPAELTHLYFACIGGLSQQVAFTGIPAEVFHESSRPSEIPLETATTRFCWASDSKISTILPSRCSPL